ncbi:MAG: hypothetical protein HW380_1357 [Magnetococcales bacterium]|nr:hypothetical protein [Magnetococcales bacterium]HIJ83075.1 hypothetical protein [Magnetococcales bacterium]
MPSLPKFSVFLSAIALVLVIHGCATVDGPVPDAETSFPESMNEQDRFFAEHGVRDARFQGVKGYEYLKINDNLRQRISQYNQQQGLVQKREFIRQFLVDAGEINDQFITASVDKIPPKKLTDFLAKPHKEMDFRQGGDTPQERFVNAYQLHAHDELDKEIQKVFTLANVKGLDAYWGRFVLHIDESIKTRDRMTRLLATAPAVPFVQAWIWYHALTDDRSAHVPIFPKSNLYRPQPLDKTSPPGGQEDWTLLNDFAPIVVQEIQDEPKYDKKADYFGEVFLQGQNPESAIPGVHSNKPTLYAYIRHTQIQKIPVKQLVYTLWYPQHPQLKSFDPEAGPMEGWTFRITLNRDHKPLIYESVSNCGCYYKVFPSERLENWSRQQYPSPLDGKKFHLEQEVSGIDAVVPELVASPDGPPKRVVLYYSAGQHQLVSVRLENQLASSQPAKKYVLKPYDLLEKLPFNNDHLSLFDEDGLVRQAHRPECTLLAPSGLYHAGHPRQRETQMIYFDQAEFDDPTLLETYFRLPDGAFGRPF